MSINTVWQQIKQYETESSREGCVRLLAVSKRQSIEAIQAVAEMGQRDFAENICQEALPKIAALKQYELTWHFIGHVQANKTGAISQHFAWVHSVDREKIAQRLSNQRPSDLPPLNVCIQVNIDNEATKSGIDVADLESLAACIAKLPRIKLRGLMAVPKPVDDFTAQRQPFQRLREAFLNLNQLGYGLDTLSMGMSHDFRAAIAEGATMIRVGTAIFGART